MTDFMYRLSPNLTLYGSVLIWFGSYMVRSFYGSVLIWFGTYRVRSLYGSVLIWNNIIRHYVVMGPPGSLYDSGYYHGKLVFPKEYPFKAPSIFMITPNGRFKVNLNF